MVDKGYDRFETPPFEELKQALPQKEKWMKSRESSDNDLSYNLSPRPSPIPDGALPGPTLMDALDVLHKNPLMLNQKKGQKQKVISKLLEPGTKKQSTR